MIYLITDGKMPYSPSYLERLYALMEEGLDAIIVREKKHEDIHERKAAVRTLATYLLAYKKSNEKIKTQIIIHSFSELVAELEADGLHLPYSLWVDENTNTKRLANTCQTIGFSVHMKEELRQIEGVASYVLVSPVFVPSCKPVEGRGTIWLEEVAKESHVPVVALGGITPYNAPSIYKVGIMHIAVMSYLLEKDSSLQSLYPQKNSF